MQIDKDLVLRAYEATKITPQFGEWGNAENNCGCAITAVAVYLKNDQFPNVAAVENTIDNPKLGASEIYGNWLGMTRHYTDGFIDGFDGGSSNTDRCDDEDELTDYEEGYKNGCAARQAVMAKYFPSPGVMEA